MFPTRRQACIADCYCVYCGHVVMTEGVAILSEDDTDRHGHGRDRCADTFCDSRHVARYSGGVLVVAEEEV